MTELDIAFIKSEELDGEIEKLLLDPDQRFTGQLFDQVLRPYLKAITNDTHHQPLQVAAATVALVGAMMGSLAMLNSPVPRGAYGGLLKQLRHYQKALPEKAKRRDGYDH